MKKDNIKILRGNGITCVVRQDEISIPSFKEELKCLTKKPIVVLIIGFIKLIVKRGVDKIFSNIEYVWRYYRRKIEWKKLEKEIESK